MLERKEADMNDTPTEFELDSDSDIQIKTKIEPTKAEEEAFARGLQTIKNDDLEEVRELGSGAYGVVYHGKCKGSDLGIKRIKASCFAGNPSGDSTFDRLSTNIRSVQSPARKSRLQNFEGGSNFKLIAPPKCHLFLQYSP